MIGNVTSAIPGAEIDPALSALIGRPATVVGVPASAIVGRAGLAAFADTAVDPADIGRHRTLLPATDSLSVNAVLNRTIFGNVSATFNGRSPIMKAIARLGLARRGLGCPRAIPIRPLRGIPPSIAILASSGR